MNYQGYEISSEIDGLSIITSAVIPIPSNKSLILNIDNLKYEFKFADDDGLVRYEGKANDTDSIYNFIFYNHKNSIGEGELSPIEIATINNVKVYLTYYVTTLPSKNRIFQYVLYHGANK